MFASSPLNSTNASPVDIAPGWLPARFAIPGAMMIFTLSSSAPTSAFVDALARTGDGSLRTLDVCGCVGVAEDRRALRALLPSLHDDDRTAFVFHT